METGCRTCGVNRIISWCFLSYPIVVAYRSDHLLSVKKIITISIGLKSVHAPPLEKTSEPPPPPCPQKKACGTSESHHAPDNLGSAMGTTLRNRPPSLPHTLISQGSFQFCVCLTVFLTISFSSTGNTH